MRALCAAPEHVCQSLSSSRWAVAPLLWASQVLLADRASLADAARYDRENRIAPLFLFDGVDGSGREDSGSDSKTAQFRDRVWTHPTQRPDAPLNLVSSRARVRIPRWTPTLS